MAATALQSTGSRKMTPATLINPCLDRIVQGSPGKRYAKLHEDCLALQKHFEALPTAAARQPAAKGPSVSPAEPSPALPETDAVLVEAEGGTEVSLDAAADSQDTQSSLPAAAEQTSDLTVDSANAVGSISSPAYSSVLPDKLVTDLLAVLHAAHETRTPKVEEAILDCLQRLVAHALITGEVDVMTSQPSAEGAASPADANSALTPAGEVIDLMCKGVEIAGEQIELQVLKGLLTTVSCTTLQVHGEALLRIVRICYNIFLASKSEMNQSTAKACLTQMLTTVFHRMETDSTTMAPPTIVVADMMVSGDELVSPVMQFVQTFVNKVMTDLESAFYAPIEPTNSQGVLEENEEALSHHKDHSDPSKPDHPALPQDSDIAVDKDGGESSPVAEPEMSQRSALLHRDAFLVFRALCKLSMKPPTEGIADAFQTRGKALSLELVKILLENSGKVFRTSPKFIGSIRQYLSMSLLRNNASPIPQAVQLSCSIFGTLLSKFREQLKAEIGVFFPMIFIQPLEVSTGPVASRISLLKVLEKHCQDSQLLVDLFVNYDCDLEASNLFERMVNTLVKIAQRSPHMQLEAGVPTAALESTQAIKCLVCILRSLSNWVDQQGEDEVAQSASAVVSAAVSAVEVPVTPDGEGPSEVARGHARTVSGAEAAPEASSAQQTEADHFEARKADKLLFQEAIALFNKKPKKGIALLQKQGKLGTEPEDLVVFLKTTENLDRSTIGDFLGEREDFSLKVMHAYVDSMDFSGLTFDDAIRSFLAGFRLPGEAQKIDRLMEKFAERYCKNNPRDFKSAETAYVLAYSVIMLNTDAHNPMVKNKMSREEFLKNNRQIDDGQDLPVEFMENIYQRITTNEIKMRDTEAPTAGQAKAQTNRLGLDLLLNLLPGRRSVAADELTEDQIRSTQAKLAQRSSTQFHAANHWRNVRPMLEVAWAPMLASFSQHMEESDDPQVVSLCLQGLRYAIRITSIMCLETLRDAFITCLTKFTHLHAPGTMQAKNVDAIKMLVQIGEEDGDYLNDAWVHILKAMSRFDLVNQLADGKMTDDHLLASLDGNNINRERVNSLRRHAKMAIGKLSLPGGKKDTGGRGRSGSKDNLAPSTPSSASSSPRSKASEGDREDSVGPIAIGPAASMEQLVPPPMGVLELIDPMDVNRMFIISDKLNSDAILHFVRGLCAVSMDELRSSDPRLFSLKKIVEISHFNMNRIRLVWSRIWLLLSDFFVTVGCHHNLKVAIHAIDSLRQLAMKFLERDELANYTFQNDFMKPFVVVMRQSASVEIRELIIRCISQMILARVSNVKSGWKSMFMVFTQAAADEQRSIVALSFETIEKIVREHFAHITETETSTFTDCVNCLIAFTNSHFNMDISLNAIAFLRFCALKLAEGAIGNLQLPERRADASQDTSTTPTNSFTDTDVDMYFWFPLLAGLSELTFDSRPPIRRSALEVLFDILKIHGSLFSDNFWARVFDSILLPIFDHIRADRMDATQGDNAEFELAPPSVDGEASYRDDIDAWLYETCTHCLQHLVNLFVQFYHQVHPLHPRLLDLLTGFIRRPHERLAAVGVAALSRLLLDAGTLFSSDIWQAVLDSLTEMMRDTQPGVRQLAQSPPATASEDAAQQEVGKGAATAAGEGGTWGVQQMRGFLRAAREMKCHTATQRLLVEALGETYHAHGQRLSRAQVAQLLEMLNVAYTHAQACNADPALARLLQASAAAASATANTNLPPANRSTAASVSGNGWWVTGSLIIPNPPLLSLEVDCARVYLALLMDLHALQGGDADDVAHVEARLVRLSTQVMSELAGSRHGEEEGESDGGREGGDKASASGVCMSHEEVATRAPVVETVLHALSQFPLHAFKKHLPLFFPLLTDLIASTAITPKVSRKLSCIFADCIGPVLLDKLN